MGRIGLLLLAFWWVTGCSTSEVLVAHSVPLTKAAAEAPEAELLDVGIKVFESGVPAEGEGDKLTEVQRRDIRSVSGMRYAADLSPQAFKGYVVDDGKGRYNLNRLPATDDPMYDRTQLVRQRERLFLDTLDEHYEKFYVDAGD